MYPDIPTFIIAMGLYAIGFGVFFWFVAWADRDMGFVEYTNRSGFVFSGIIVLVGIISFLIGLIMKVIV